MRRRMAIAALVGLGLVAQFGCERKESDRTSRNRSTDRSTRVDDARDTTGMPVTGDSSFLTTACQANLAEVAAGKLASDRASSSDVKKFAQHMIDDHSRANSELTDLARRKGITLPDTADDAHQRDAAKLAELSGADFDRKYASMMVTDHVKAVSLFEENAKTAKDRDVRAFAEKYAPKLRDHLKMARDLNGKLGGPPTAD